MTIPPQGHPYYELKRRIADCRERLRRTRPGQKSSAHDAPASAHGANDAATADEADEAHTPTRRPASRRAARR